MSCHRFPWRHREVHQPQFLIDTRQWYRSHGVLVILKIIWVCLCRTLIVHYRLWVVWPGFVWAIGVGDCLGLEITTYGLGHFPAVCSSHDTSTVCVHSHWDFYSFWWCVVFKCILWLPYSFSDISPLDACIHSRHSSQRHGGACWPVGKGGHHQLHPRKGPGWSCRRIYHWTQGTHQPPQTEVATLPLLQQSPSARGRWSQQGVLSTIKFIVMETQISRAIVLLLKM